MTFPNHLTIIMRDGTWLATCLRCGHRAEHPDIQRLKLEMQKHRCREEREAGKHADSRRQS